MTDKERFDLLMQHVLLMFDYGSSVYGTLTEQSARDIVCIVDDSCDLSDAFNRIWEYHDTDNNDYQFLNERDWIEKIKNHHILWLECYMLFVLLINFCSILNLMICSELVFPFSSFLIDCTKNYTFSLSV